MKLQYILLAYFIIISLITVVVTVKDKINAKKHLTRVPEKCLFLLALLGGSVSELITMKTIRHKTMHRRFMWGLPAIIVLQTALAFIMLYLLNEYL